MELDIVFKVLMGGATLWVVWLISMMGASINENAYRRAMRSKTKGYKDTERATEAEY